MLDLYHIDLYLRMIEQSAIHVYAKRLMGSPPSQNEKRPDFSDLCVINQFTKLGFNNEPGLILCRST